MPKVAPATGRRITQAEQDAAEVLSFLRKHPRVELTRAEIAEGTGLAADGARLRAAISRARWAAEKLGARLEHFLPSKDPERRGAYTLRFNPAGHGDEMGARDAFHSSRVAITAMEDMRRSCAYEAANPHSITPRAFGRVANSVELCLENVAGIQEIAEELWTSNSEKRQLADRVADLEAQMRAAGLTLG